MAVESLCAGIFIIADRVSAGGMDIFGCMLNNRFSASQARIMHDRLHDECAVRRKPFMDNVVERQDR